MYVISDRKKRTKNLIFNAVIYEVLARSLLSYMVRVSKSKPFKIVVQVLLNQNFTKHCVTRNDLRGKLQAFTVLNILNVKDFYFRELLK